MYEYILHRLYNFEFNIKPNLSDKESFFVPAGYDSITTLRESDINKELDKAYDLKTDKNVFKDKQEEEFICEDD